MTAREVYAGSDGAATKALYSRLAGMGPVGLLALNLFRASKCSGRAKLYRGGVRGQGSYRQMAYERKNWSMQQLCETLTTHAEAVKLEWGWQQDPEQEYHKWVLYVDLPGQGQVSFHSGERYKGPDYPGKWDGNRTSDERIIAFTEALLEETACLLKL